MLFQQIRSATIQITYNEKKFLIDPWLAKQGTYPPLPGVGIQDRGNPLTDLPISIDEILDVDAVIVTHTHFDHFDETAKRLISKTMKIFVQDEVDAEELQKSGFKNLEILQYDGNQFFRTTLFKTRCKHGRDEITEKVYQQLGLRTRYDACGVVFQCENERNLYVAGDTVWFEGVKEALERFRPELIILNTARAEAPQGHPIIMGTDDLLEVCKNAPQSWIIASHMGAVTHATLTRQDIRAFLEKNQIKNVWIPEDGEAREF